MEYTSQQKHALNMVEGFISGTEGIFILKGYAGTGKTTLIEPIVRLAESKGRRVILMTPTGRAAKVLAEKTGREARTVHSAIYGAPGVDEEEGNETKESKVHYRFNLAHPEDYVPKKSLLIVDEASMVSSRKTYDEMLEFGSGVLLKDILAFARVDMGAKIVFVGDPAQLPPVGDSCSNALNCTYFESLGLGVAEFEMTDIVRQSSDSEILANSIVLRNLLKEDFPRSLSLDCKGEIQELDCSEIPKKYCAIAPNPGSSAPVVICYSNELAYRYNQMIRGRYFHNDSALRIGERLIVVANCYARGRKILNGEFATVTAASDNVETLRGSAFVAEDGCETKKRISIDLRFRDVTLLFDDGYEISVKIHDDILNGPQKRLSYTQLCGLVSNFKMRNPELKRHTVEYSEALRQDEYFNALSVKYGYAITGHKSQGGEWDTVFIDFSGRVGLNADCLRWCYTVLTRARNRIFTPNLPYVPSFRANVMAVKKVSRIPDDFFPQDAVAPAGPFHSDSDKVPVKAEYWRVCRALEGTCYRVVGIQHKPYREIYAISDADGNKFRVDFVFNAIGLFTSSVPVGAVPAEVIRMIDEMPCEVFPFRYIPSTAPLSELRTKVESLCNEAGVSVVNIVEHLENYRVVYYFRTNSAPGYLDVFVKKSGDVSFINPCSLIPEDRQLEYIVNGLRE